MRLVVLALAPCLIAAGGDISRFRAPMTPDGLLGVSGTTTLPPWQINGGLTLGYNFNPLVWRFSDGTYEPVIEHQLHMEATFAIGLFRFIDVAVGLPVLLYQYGPPPPSPFEPDPYAIDLGVVEGAGLGDLRLLPRLQFADEQTFGVGGALVAELTFNTGSLLGGQQRYFGERGVGLRPRIVGSMPLAIGRLIGAVGLRLRLAGARGVADTGFDHEFEYHLGGEFNLLTEPLPLSALAELSGAFSGGFGGAGQYPLELLAGARARVAQDLVLTAALGLGISSGVGTPVVRFVFGAAWAPKTLDQDHDGIPDSADACPYNPEDRDGFEDGDGCPENDNDEDGIIDSEDECPNDSEDYNDLDDDDGCPDEDEVDTDDDGLADVDDECPRDPEDLDDYKDDDGCPDIDNDIDGIPDDEDLCPEEKETINGVDDYDGCPDEGEALTEYVETKIEIKETILFESGKAIIKEESKDVLDQVALQILAHPNVSMVRIEGHTDALGSEEDNLFLSQDRADSVRRYLIERGVSEYRLEAVGFGESQPIDTNETLEGRAKNRRVDFVLIQDEPMIIIE